MDNLQLGPDAQVNHTLAVLRSQKNTQKLADGVSPVPGLFFMIDHAGEVDGQCVTGGGSLLRLDYTIGNRPRWLALHVQFGEADLTAATLLGIVCKSMATEAAIFRICLRSSTPDGFVDTFMPKHVVSFAEESTHIDLLRLDGNADVPAQAKWRELILFFQTTTAIFDIRDLRVFIV